MSDLIISVSGLRGVIGTSLTPDVIMRYVSAFVADLPPGPIVVARDGRTTGEMIRDTIFGTLVASGREVFDAGIAATPTVGVVVRALDAVAGIQVSASHNPPEYNGIKLFGADGRVIGAAAGVRVRDRFHDNTVAWRSFSEIGRVVRLPNPHDHHLAKVLATVDAAAIAKRRFRVLIDSNHGAGGLLGSRLLEELGCDVVTIGGVPDGLFDHPPEPTAENLAAVADKVSQFGCDIGFCQDPDADRLALIDANGHYIGEEYTVALCMMRRFEDASGVVVINCATSGMTEWLAARAGALCHRSAVGEANVCDAMIAQDAIYGGEGNGGPIDPRVGMVRDSFVGMAQILDLMQRRGQTLAELVAEIPPLAIHKSKVSVDTTLLPKIFDHLCRAMPDASANLQDGLRLAWPDSWLLVRGSNTEPIVRLIAESPTQSRSSSLCDAAAAVIAKIG